MQTLGMNSPDLPNSNSSLVDRRRRTRHKAHTPAYARISGESDGFLLDLNTILDLSEDGMCVQVPSGLAVNHVVHLCLELSDSNGPIYTAGKVVWSNRLGRAGIRFGELSETSGMQLKRWLSLNAIAADEDSEVKVSSGAATSAEAAKEKIVGPSAKQQIDSTPVVHAEGPAKLTDHTSMLAALAAVKREVEAQRTNLNAALQLIAERSLSFTHGSGAAIALSNGMEIVCRASAGEDAPPVGARVSTEYGLSALCIRSGEPLYCEDSEADARVDQEVCRVLGIRSILAVPIEQQGSVVGLIEVFSRQLKAFDANANLALLDLADAVTTALSQTSYPQRRSERLPEISDAAPAPDAYEEVSEPNSWFGRALLVLALVTIAIAMLWVFYPQKGTDISPPRTAGATASSAQQPAKAPVVLGDQKQMAERGDAAEQYAVGVRYAMGDGVKQDYTEASRWFSMAAAQGNVDAQSTLGAYYMTGTGVTKDPSKAYFWALLAQAGGDEASKTRVPILASRMAHQQLVTVQEQADQWLKDHRSNSSH
jgi:GAF domain-containing protein